MATEATIEDGDSDDEAQRDGDACGNPRATAGDAIATLDALWGIVANA